MLNLTDNFKEHTRTRDDLVYSLLRRVDAGHSKYTQEEMIALIDEIRQRAQDLSPEHAAALKAINDDEARAVRMLNYLAAHEGSPLRFRDEAAASKTASDKAPAPVLVFN